MRALDGTVEHTLDSKHIGDRGIHRRCKRPIPFAARAKGFKRLRFCFLVLFDLALVFGAGSGIARGNLQRHARIALALHREILFERDRFSGGLPGGSFGVKFEEGMLPAWFRD
jgi:hypothetical protein